MSRGSNNFFIESLGVILKSRESFKITFIGFSVLLFLIGCKSDDVQLPDNKLEGSINGNDWSYKSANGYLFSSDFKYRVRFLSSEETVGDPCSQPNPSITHVKAIFKPSEGSFFVAPQALDDNQVQVTFEVSTSQSITATSGFMEIYAIDNLVVVGYLQAVLDGDNKVEGSFQIRLCN
jgi:hypothetical protein